MGEALSTSHTIHVAIVTPDLIGPVANGGIGTSCTALGEFLVSSGFQVSVLLTIPSEEHRPDDGWRQRYDRLGISVDVLPRDIAPGGQALSYHPNHQHLVRSLHAYQWLAARTFKVIFFMDWQGAGFYSLSAKATGLAFRDTWLIVHTHSPTIWHSIYSHEPFTQPDQLLTSFLERRSVEMADMVVSPTTYMLDWMKGFGWSVPEESIVLPNLIPQGSPTRLENDRRSGIVRSVVFFGRLEQRKGLDLFCDAIDRIEASGGQLPAVVFLGKFGRIGGSHSGVYILSRAASWRSPIRILSHLDQPGALSWLVDNDALAVMPSVMDNAPYTIAECIVLGVPFIARASGGVPEMIAGEDHQHCLVGDNPEELAQKIIGTFSRPMPCARLAPPLQHANSRWRAFVAQLLRQAPSRPRLSDYEPYPLVSVCIVHKDRPQLLRQALRSAQQQTYPSIEIILVDDGSVGSESLFFLESIERDFRDRGWTILRQPNRYLGAARNAAFRKARGKWILFLDDDNVCRPSQIETLVSAALISGADILTSLMDVFEGGEAPGSATPILERFLPLGGAVAYGLFRNGFGDACALYRRAILEAIGGFTEDFGVGCEDYELFARATMAGATIVAVPEALFWYRRHKNSMLKVTSEMVNAARALRPYISRAGADLREVAYLAHGVVAAPNLRSKTPPLLLALKKAEEALSAGALGSDLGFWRTWAMAILNEVVNDLEASDTPDSKTSALNLAILLLCCNHLEAARDVLYMFRKDTTYKNATLEMARALWALINGYKYSMPEPDALTIKAFVAASWFVPMEEGSLATLKGIITRANAAPRTGESFSYAVDILRAHDQQYLDQKSDVVKAVLDGHFASGSDHYME